MNHSQKIKSNIAEDRQFFREMFSHVESDLFRDLDRLHPPNLRKSPTVKQIPRRGYRAKRLIWH